MEYNLILNGYDPWAGNAAELYYYDDEDAQKKINFVERCLKHITGRMAGKPLLLNEWQKTYYRLLFGFKRKKDNLRRYRTSHIFIPRGGGKSTFASAVAMTFLCACKFGSPEVYLAGPTSEVANRCFGFCCAMRETSPKLYKKLKPLKGRGRIIYARKNAFLHRCSGETAGGIGQIPAAIVIDETWLLDGLRGKCFYEALVTGLGKREGEDPFLLTISTAGYDRTTIAYEHWKFNQMVWHKPETAYSHLPLTFAADPDCDWKNIETYRKCNPTVLDEDFITSEIAKAEAQPSYEGMVKRQYLNIWTEQCTAFVKMNEWYKLPRNEIEITKSDMVVGGLDTSSTIDSTSLVLYCPSKNWMRAWFWIPAKTAHQKGLMDGVDYNSWKNNTHCQVNLTHGERINRKALVEEIKKLAEKYWIGGIAYDSYEGRQYLAEDLSVHGIKMVEWKASYADMNAPTKQFELLVNGGQLNVGDNLCFDWHVNNIEVKELNGLLRPIHPEDPSKRCDGAVAAIMSVGLAAKLKPFQVFG